MRHVPKESIRRVERLHAQTMELFDLVPLSKSKPAMARRIDKLWPGRKGKTIDVDGRLIRPSAVTMSLLKTKEFQRVELKKPVVFAQASGKDRALDQAAREAKKRGNKEKKVLEAKRRAKDKRKRVAADRRLVTGESSDSE